jgi:hypothetical protein
LQLGWGAAFQKFLTGPGLSPTEAFMSLQAETQEFLDYLRANESVTSLIKAARHKTLLYSGGFF